MDVLTPGNRRRALTIRMDHNQQEFLLKKTLLRLVCVSAVLLASSAAHAQEFPSGTASNKVRSTSRTIGSRGSVQTSPMFEPGVRLTNYKVAEQAPSELREFDFFSLSEVSTDPNGEITMDPNGDVSITGFVFTTNDEEFKIRSGKLIAGKEDYVAVRFETESRSGISYTFSGRFLKRPKRLGGQYVELEGTLTKFSSSRKIVAARLKFYKASRG